MRVQVADGALALYLLGPPQDIDQSKVISNGAQPGGAINFGALKRNAGRATVHGTGLGGRVNTCLVMDGAIPGRRTGIGGRLQTIW